MTPFLGLLWVAWTTNVHYLQHVLEWPIPSTLPTRLVEEPSLGFMEKSPWWGLEDKASNLLTHKQLQ